MYTIALINQKGGCGKTTVALSLAVAFQQAGQPTVILDLDPQASATEWHDARADKNPHVENINPSRLSITVEKVRELGAEILILDTAPHSESTSLQAARIADLVLIPCQPSIMDLRAMTKTIELMKLVQVPCFAVLNGVQHHSLSAATAAEKTIERTLGLAVAPVRLGERVAYSRCLIAGQAAQEYEPDGKAAREIFRLQKWVAARLTAGNRKAA
jgi:chromosome partitioning protein